MGGTGHRRAAAALAATASAGSAAELSPASAWCAAELRPHPRGLLLSFACIRAAAFRAPPRDCCPTPLASAVSATAAPAPPTSPAASWTRNGGHWAWAKSDNLSRPLPSRTSLVAASQVNGSHGHYWKSYSCFCGCASPILPKNLQPFVSHTHSSPGCVRSPVRGALPLIVSETDIIASGILQPVADAESMFFGA